MKQQPLLPLPLGALDHYTLIVEDAEKVADFHINILGFHYLKTQMVNTGTAKEGEYDMLNIVLETPTTQATPVICVITEGLTEASIFKQYLLKHGAGIHHIAYRVDDLQNVFNTIKQMQIATTSDEIIIDPVSGLRQIFLARENTGYFIELIERSKADAEDLFVHDNMAKLANTMRKYVK